MKYSIGIDNSSTDHKVHLIDENFNKILKFIITNDLIGFEKLNNILSSYKDVMIGFELPHGPIVDYLRLKGYVMYSINPLKIKRFKESYIISGNKNDDIDAEAIAHYLLRYKKQLKPLMFNSPKIEELKILMLSHNRLTKEHARNKNRLLFIFRQYFPLYADLFTDHASKIQLKMLFEYPRLYDLKTTTNVELTKFLKKNYYRNGKYIQKVLDRINSYDHVICAEIESALYYEAITLAKMLLLLKEELKNIESKMNKIRDTHNLGPCFKSLPGSGNVLSCKLLAIFGDNKERFTSANGVQCLFGTAPRNYQSGSYHKIIMRKACNKTGKSILYQFAFSSMKSSQWAKDYYYSQKEKGKKHTVAVRALSNKWVKVIYKLWKDEIFYDENHKIQTVA